MLCPVCRKLLVIVEYDSVELDMCPFCRGLWFDAQELHQLFELAAVPEHCHDLEAYLERLPHQGGRRCCPRCGHRMLPARAPSKSHAVILDECPRGHGLWFDQGELEALFACLLGDHDQALSRVRSYLGQFATTNQ